MFSQNLTLHLTFETVAQINEELKRAEFDGAFCIFHRFSSLFRQAQKIDTENNPSKEKYVGVTKRLRSLNPGKSIAMAIYCIIVHFINQCARSCVTWRVNLRGQYSKDAQKQLAPTSLNSYCLLSVWMVKMTRDPRYFNLIRHTKICSEHFTSDDFIDQYSNKNRSVMRTCIGFQSNIRYG